MKNIQIKHSKTDRDWSCSWTKKELMALLLFIMFMMTIVEFLTVWSLRSMPNNMMKVVLVFIPLLVGMVIEVIILSFGGVKQNEN